MIIELRGFALIGMLECWNNGTMGSGKMQSCCIGGIFIDRKIIN
jgi:hypothetical protein